MSTTTKNDNISMADLSPAEIEQIKLNREKAALAEKEKENAKKLKREKAIKDVKEEIVRDLAYQAKTKAAYEKFISELTAIDIGFVLEPHQFEKDYEAYEYEWIDDPENPGKHKSQKIVYHTEKIARESYMIKHKISGDSIEVKEHFTGSHGRTNQGFKMFFAYSSNRPYINAKKIATIVQEKIDKNNREIKAKNNKAIAKDLAVNELTAKYHDAKIEATSAHTRFYGYTEVIKVTFNNNIQVVYRYGLEADKLKLSFEEISGIKNENIEKVIDALKGI